MLERCLTARVNEVKLFDKLIDRGFPSMLVNVLLDNNNDRLTAFDPGQPG